MPLSLLEKPDFSFQEPPPTENLIIKYLKQINKTLCYFDGWCLDLCMEANDWLSSQGIPSKVLYIEHKSLSPLKPKEPLPYSFNNKRSRPIFARWGYHCVIEVNGYIHDAWFSKFLPLDEYLIENFGCTKKELSVTVET